MEIEDSPIEEILLNAGWQKGYDSTSHCRAIYWLKSQVSHAENFGYGDYCRTNDRPPRVVICEYAPITFQNGNTSTWNYELRLVSDSGHEWVDFRFYSLSASDICGKNSKLKKLGSQLVKMWNLLDKEELDDE